MLHIGCHLSSAKGYARMGEDALRINADTFQFFSRNPRGSRAKKVDAADAARLTALRREHAFAPVLAHAPYTLNACAADPGLRDFAAQVMTEDIATLDKHVPDCLYVFHPGNHVGQGVEAGIDGIARLLNGILHPDQQTPVLLETMSGKGTEIGKNFEELRRIMDQVALSGKLGICLDTCHIFSAGYDIVTGLDAVLGDFDRIIGLRHLRAIHLNDSLTPFASGKDRHAALGKGSIGLPAFQRIVTHPSLRDLPFFLETPHENLAGYAEEIAMMRAAAEQAV